MRISFDIKTVEDAALVGEQLQSLLSAFGARLPQPSDTVHQHDEPVVEAPEPAPKVRRARSGLKPEPEAVGEPASSIPAEAVQETAGAPVDATEARERLRDIARERGVAWLREVMAERDAVSLAALTDAQVIEIVHAHH